MTLVDGLRPDAVSAEIRRDLAGPLAVRVVAAALELLDVEPAVVLGWYDEIVAAVDRVSAGGEIGDRARPRPSPPSTGTSAGRSTMEAESLPMRPRRWPDARSSRTPR